MGIFGFRRDRKKDEPRRDDALEAAVATAGEDPAGAGGARELTPEHRLRFEERLLAQDLEKARNAALGSID